MKANRCFLIIIACLIYTCLASQTTITVNNAEPRLDTEGNIVDAHDGRTIYFNGRFYWYGTSYGNTSGFTTDNEYVCYSSADMQAWTYEGALLPDAPEGVYYRPHVVYNKAADKYVLWYNWYPVLWDGQFGVAVSDQPQGPFEIVNADVQVKNSEIGVGDFGIFVDEDEMAYLAYNTIQNHQVSIERLSPDYLSSTMENSGFISKYCEAGSMFKRAGKYYLLTDFTCCFCGQGSGARVYLSDSPLGPYENTGNINRYPGKPLPQLTDGVFHPYGKQEISTGSRILLETEGMPYQKVTLTLPWGNYRTHCQPENDTLVHPDHIVPEFSLLDQVGEKLLPTAVELENYYNRLRITLKLEEPLSETVILQLDTSYLENTALAEIELGGDATVQAFLLHDKKPVIIPAQQAHIMEIPTSSGTVYIWIGDLWGSRPDNIKGHDQQYWSAPLQFREDGTIRRMEWVDEWSVKLK